MSIVAINLEGFAVILVNKSERKPLCFFSISICILLEETNAISIPEKKAEKKAQQDAENEDLALSEQQTENLSEELNEEQKQAQQELQQWLRRVPDDPGGLLREKFRYQSRQRALEQRRPPPPSEQQQERW